MTRKLAAFAACFLILTIAMGGAAEASFWGKVTSIFGGGDEAQQEETTTATEPAATETKKTETSLTQAQLDGGIKDTLFLAIKTAISQLGQTNGFLDNPLVKIAMPEKLQQVEEILRKIGQGQLADQFIESMNRAAETAVPKTTAIFTNAVKTMSVDEAMTLLKGKDNAVTNFFETKTRNELYEEIFPVVTEATNKAKVTLYYKAMIAKAQTAVPFLKTFSPDLDSYVTEKALDGLFTVMAEEEKRIREDPAARATDLLKTVWGQIGQMAGVN